MFCTIAPVRTPKIFSTERKITMHDGGQVLRIQADVHVAQDHWARLGNRRDMRNADEPVVDETEWKEDAEKLAEGDADRRDGSRLHHQKQRPAVEEAPHRPERLAQINILAAGVRHHGRQFAVGERARDGQESGHQPCAHQQRGRIDLAGDIGRDNEDAGADHRTHHQHGGAGQPEPFYELAFAGGNGDGL